MVVSTHTASKTAYLHLRDNLWKRPEKDRLSLTLEQNNLDGVDVLIRLTEKRMDGLKCTEDNGDEVVGLAVCDQILIQITQDFHQHRKASGNPLDLDTWVLVTEQEFTLFRLGNAPPMPTPNPPSTTGSPSVIPASFSPTKGEQATIFYQHLMKTVLETGGSGDILIALAQNRLDSLEGVLSLSDDDLELIEYNNAAQEKIVGLKVSDQMLIEVTQAFIAYRLRIGNDLDNWLKITPHDFWEFRFHFSDTDYDRPTTRATVSTPTDAAGKDVDPFCLQCTRNVAQCYSHEDRFFPCWRAATQDFFRLHLDRGPRASTCQVDWFCPIG